MKKEWKIIFYEDEKGCPVKDFINELNEKKQKKIIALIKYLNKIGIELKRPYCDTLKDGIHELRFDNTRTLYFFCFENYIILTHSFVKKTQKIPEKEMKKALEYKENFLKKHCKENIEKLKLWEQVISPSQIT